MEAGSEYDRSMIEKIFQNFKGRRAGLIKAFTTDVEEFFRQCDPDKSDRARLFSKINDLPTVSETVLGSFEKPSKEKSSATTHKGILKFRTHKGHTIMDEDPEYDPSIVENIFQDFKGRRAALIKALTTDSQKLFWQCDPAKENSCLFGFPDKTWSVDLPAEEIPPEIPEPLLGINFGREGMLKKDWLKLVAVYSDSWLLSVAFYIATRFAVGKSDSMINDLPTVYEALLESFEKPSKKVEDGEGVEEQDDSVMCLICYKDYSYRDEHWIVCDVCHNWFHFGCVDITQEIAAQMMEYKCPFCLLLQLQL